MKKGFTLLELLIVIGILAILATATVLVLNPAELLRQARDSQRVSDLATLNSALALYATAVASPSFQSATSGSCASHVFNYGTVVASSTYGNNCAGAGTPTTTNSRAVNGSGWVPVNLAAIPGGSPIGSLPVDPVNSGASSSAQYIYLYRCSNSSSTWEFNAVLESTKFASTDNLDGTDGGTCSTVYEVGNQLDL